MADHGVGAAALSAALRERAKESRKAEVALAAARRAASMPISFPYPEARPDGLSILHLHPRQIVICDLGAGWRALTILENGREVFQEKLDAASAAHLAALLAADPVEAA